MKWRELFRGCAERFGWPPPVVLDLTPQEVASLLGAEPADPKRTVTMSPQQLRAFLREKGKA